MTTEFRRAVLPKELRSLIIFDHKAFQPYPADWFCSSDWARFETWWMIVDGRKIGCCAFERNVDFQGDIRENGENIYRRGSLYIATTGILPSFHRLGFGGLLKAWQIAYARSHGFTRMVTNTRKSNVPMINLNARFGFKTLRTTPNYYASPRESTIVMELRF